MRTMVISFIILFAVFLSSCEKEKPEGGDIILKSGQLLVGYWMNPQYEDTIVTYTRSNSLNEDGYSFSFETENKFIERKNAGWCGTPPIYYDNFEGTWEQENDSIVNITTGYWGGTVDYQWEILELTNKKLRVTLLEQEYHNNF